MHLPTYKSANIVLNQESQLRGVVAETQATIPVTFVAPSAWPPMFHLGSENKRAE